MQEGKRPDEVITAELNIGGILLDSASHGNTGVFINEREITGKELKMLKFAGVQCPPGTHLWVYPDGTYQEQGQKNMKGNIWGKATSWFLNPFCPMPYKLRSGQNIHHISVKTLCNHLQRRNKYKILLLGYEGSGTSTIFKQAKYLFREDGSTKKELEDMKVMIQKNIYKYIGILLEGREHFEEEMLVGLLLQDTQSEKCELSDEVEEGMQDTHKNMSTKALKEGPATPLSDQLFDIGDFKSREPSLKENIYSMDSRLRNTAEWFSQIIANGTLDTFFPMAAREYAPVIADLWSDSAIQATFCRKAELHMLPDVAKFFLDRVVEVSMNEYEPDEKDILYGEGLPQGVGLSEFEFSFDFKNLCAEVANNEHNDLPSAAIRYQLIRISANGLDEGCKWLGMLEGMRIVVFCVAINEYDQIWIAGNGQLTNKMLLSRELFKSILKHPCFQDTPFLLLLNKYDLFEEKIGTVPLTACEWFSDFDPVRASHYSPQMFSQHAYTYVAHKYKKLFESLSTPRRKLYTLQLKARDRAIVCAAFQYIHEILKWDDAK